MNGAPGLASWAELIRGEARIPLHYWQERRDSHIIPHQSYPTNRGYLLMPRSRASRLLKFGGLALLAPSVPLMVWGGFLISPRCIFAAHWWGVCGFVEGMASFSAYLSLTGIVLFFFGIFISRQPEEDSSRVSIGMLSSRVSKERLVGLLINLGLFSFLLWFLISALGFFTLRKAFFFIAIGITMVITAQIVEAFVVDRNKRGR